MRDKGGSMAEKKDGQLHSESGIPIKNIYTPEDLKDIDYDRGLGLPGHPPFTS